MISSQDTIVKDLVLIGGGHSHVEVLKNFGMKPIPGVRLTLIARDVQTPYSGMLPGYVAGHYDYDQAHIDLRPLCQFASARLYHDTAIKIDPANKQVMCEGRPPVSYDLLSINIGSRPEISSVPGAAEFTTPVKPINRFVDKWHHLLERVLQHSGPHRIAVVGAGAAGVEILLAIQYRLKTIMLESNRQEELLEFHLISKTPQIMPAFSASVASRFERILRERGVIVHRSSEATCVNAGQLILNKDIVLELDEVLWVTGASAPAWLKESGLSVDDKGFINARDSLQSTSHDDIFAAGDIVNVVNHPRPKAGVFAVRQGKPLSNNLRRVLFSQKPKSFSPQKTLLALISSGNKYAVASKAFLNYESKLLWAWKDWIDRTWMQRYSDLPSMVNQANLMELKDSENNKEDTLLNPMRCGGCGAKVDADILSRTINSLNPHQRDDILIGLHEPDDAAVVDIPNGKVMVHSVDYFRSFVDDPYIFGQIAANHALSDIFAMGAEAQSALAIATIPYASESKIESSLRELMAGALIVLNDAKTSLVGGHTSEGAELALGFSVNGIADRKQLIRKGGMQPGDVLILTKPVGTGTLFAANMQLKAKGRWIESAIESMLQSNRIAAEIMFNHSVTACTDVTGFGLVGHLLEMIKPSHVDVEIDLNSIPLLEGAIDTSQLNILSSLHPANLRAQNAILNRDDARGKTTYPLLFDPQTSGGLLASVPSSKADQCLTVLNDSGFTKAAVIGTVGVKQGQQEVVHLTF